MGISTACNGGNTYTFIANPANGGTALKCYRYVNGMLLLGEAGRRLLQRQWFRGIKLLQLVWF